MRVLRVRMRLPILCLLLPLAACGADDGSGGSPPVPEAATPTPASVQERPADALAGDLVASINEPFWQARVEARALQLGGVDQESPRWLDIVEDVRQARLRRILARDAIGEVELRVEDLPCEDSMSGARFPFSALLSIADGDAVAGCARPASMPQPREPG